MEKKIYTIPQLEVTPLELGFALCDGSDCFIDPNNPEAPKRKNKLFY